LQAREERFGTGPHYRLLASNVRRISRVADCAKICSENGMGRDNAKVEMAVNLDD